MYSVYFIVSKKEYSGQIRLYYPLEDHNFQYLGTETNPLLAMRKITAIRPQIIIYDSQISSLSYEQFMDFLENNEISLAVIVLNSGSTPIQDPNAPASWLNIQTLTPENISLAFTSAVEHIVANEQKVDEAIFIPRLSEDFLKACLDSDTRIASFTGSATLFPKVLWHKWHFYLIFSENSLTTAIQQNFELHCIRTIHNPFYINRITEHELLVISGNPLKDFTIEKLNGIFPDSSFGLITSSCSRAENIPTELCLLVQYSSRCRYFHLKNREIKTDFFINHSVQNDFSSAENVTEKLLLAILTRDLSGIEHNMNALFSDLIFATLNIDYAEAVYTLLVRICTLLNCLADSQTDLSLYRRGSSLKADQHRMTEELKSFAASQPDLFQNINDVVIKVLFYAAMHYHEQHKLSDVANAAGVTNSYLCTLLKSSADTTYNKLLTDLRLSHARYLLINHPELSVAAIAHTVGFEDPNYFSKVFKQKTGKTPLHYQKEGT